MYRDYRRIENYPDYIISNYGEVYSLKYGKVRELKHGGKKYRHVNIGGKYPSVHELVGNHFIGNRHGEMTFDHIDRIRTNNRADNIMLATKLEQSANTGVHHNNKLGEKHISNKVNKSGNEYFHIQIIRNKKLVLNRCLNKKKFSLEDAIKLRDDFLLTWSATN